MFISRRDFNLAVARRDGLAKEIQSFAIALPFDQCMRLCGTDLLEEYLDANKLVCILEQMTADAAMLLPHGTGRL